MKEDPDFFFFFAYSFFVETLRETERTTSEWWSGLMCADISRHTKKDMTGPPQPFLTERLHRKHRALEATTSPQGTRDAIAFLFFPQIHLLFWTCFTKGGGGRGEKKTIFRLDLKLLRFAAYLTVH